MHEWRKCNMTSQELPVFRFYDRKSKRRRHELEKTVDHMVKRFRDEKLPQEFKHRITGPSTEWKTFFRQQDAFDFARQKTEDSLHVFAFESGMFGEEHGQRMYLVATYPVFWHYYSQLKESDRHHYEVIPEGAVCKLYFDLEFSRLVNIDKDGRKMMEVFIKYVCLWLEKWYSVSCSRKDILDLEASTMEKFSRHLIFQLNNVAFKDNVNAGQFVHHIFNKLLDRVMDSSQGHSSTEMKLAKDTEKSSAEDSGVKSDFLAARQSDMTNSGNDSITKPGMEGDTLSHTRDKNDSGFESPCKSAGSLVKTETDEKANGDLDTKKTENDKSAAEILSQFSEKELKSLVVLSKDGKPVLFCDMGVYTKNRNFRLLRSTKLGKKNPFVVSDDNLYKPKPVPNSQKGFELFSDSLISNVRYADSLRILTFESGSQRTKLGNSRMKMGKGNSSDADTIEGYTKSPYPEIDDFIQKTVGDGGKNGCIRHWTYFTEGELLIYDIARYRWCANIQRQHRSNNIMLCVDMKKGVYYQKCHDPDCKADNFKSDDYPLPAHVLPSHYFDDTGNGLDSDFDDDDIVQAAEVVEKTYQKMQDESDDDLLSATMEMEKSLD